jgi:hypothetical protein
MMRLSVILVVAAILGALRAFAGEPIDEEVVCPVGGEKFNITSTMSCSEQGTTMSLRRETTCDFITRLPVCPGNGLPIYREFSQVEVKSLEAFLQTETYAALGSKSPYLRAYAIEDHLAGTGTATTFNIMLRAVWYDSEVVRADPDGMALFLKEAEGERLRASPGDKPFLLALTAYQLAAAGRDDEARIWLEEARASGEPSEFLKSYIDAVNNCIGRMTSDSCSEWATLQ